MTRSFDAAALPPEVVAEVLAAAEVAPAAGNTDALDLVVLEGAPETERYWAVTFGDPAARASFGWPGLFAAPLLVLVYVRPSAYPERYAEADKAATGLGAGLDAWPVPYWWVDGGGAVTALLLAADGLGLGACFFGQFEHEAALRAAFGVPDDRRALGTLALGRAAIAGERPGRSSGRPRRSPDQRIHRGAWSPSGPV